MRIFVLLAVMLTGCTGLPKSVEPVADFKLDSYLGTWYEIARLDHRFERGLNNVTAEYTLKDSGMVTVKNRGYASAKGQWKEAIGKAKFKGDDDVGHLLVSFFGPIYASYAIFELDDYQHAFVSGSNLKNLWFLSRTPTVSDADKKAFVDKVAGLGFDTSGLIWVEHDQ